MRFINLILKRSLVLFFSFTICFINPAFSAKNRHVKNKDLLEMRITKLNPKINKDRAKRLSRSIKKYASINGLDPVLIASILMTESSFNQAAESKTNDVSIAQINLSVWTPLNFKKATGEDLNHSRLRSDENYAISSMCKILKYYKKSYPKDKEWFARYHSSTLKLKEVYAKKIRNYTIASNY
jgi:hypothetical protein